jgi:hypothetical protein
MGDDNIPNKTYSETKIPTCPKCNDPLTMDDMGCWYCEDPICNYTEYNNLTKCRGECGGEILVLSSTDDFFNLEDRYCQVIGEHGGSCLGIAQAESSQLDYEDYKMRAHIQSCNDENCDCRNY